MFRFLSRVALFAAAQAGIAAVLFRADPAVPNSYFAAALDHHRRLDTLPPPRLILVGGSSLAFGVDAEALEARTGRPTVSMGLHAGLGEGLMLNEVRDRVGPGDVVALSIEYEPLFRGHVGGPEVLDMIEARPETAWDVPPGYLPVLLDSGLEYLCSRVRRSVQAWTTGVPPAQPPYTRDSFTLWGNVVGHRDLPPMYDERAALARVTLDAIRAADVAAAAGRLSRFQDDCRRRGARAVFFFPQVDELRAEKNAATLRMIDAAFRERSTVPVLISPAEATLPVRCFFDTAYHLTPDGMRRRTDLMADRLAAYLRDPVIK